MCTVFTVCTVPVFILNFLLNIDQILGANVPLQILAEDLRRGFEVLLIVLEQLALIILLEVIREHVGEHEGSATLAQDVHCLLEELHLDPGHVVLLHLLHLVLDHLIELVLELERLEVVHVAVAVEKVPLQGRSRLLLIGPGHDGVVLVVTVAIIPTRAVRFPRAQADPAKVHFAALVLAYHMIATAVLLDRRVTSRAFLKWFNN